MAQLGFDCGTSRSVDGTVPIRHGGHWQNGSKSRIYMSIFICHKDPWAAWAQTVRLYLY